MRWTSLLRAIVAVAVVLYLAPSVVLAQDFDFSDDDDAGADSGSSKKGKKGKKGGEDAGGDFDFDFEEGGGAKGGPAEAAPQAVTNYVIDENSPSFKTMEEANAFSQQGKHYQASLLYWQVLQGGDDTAKALESRARYELGRTLYQLGLYQSALTQFDKILQAGPASEFFLPTLQWLVLIARELPGDPAKASRIYENYLNLFPQQIDPSLLAEVGLLMGQAAYANGLLDDVVFFMGHVDENSALYPKARFIEGVTFVRQYNGQQAVESFKDILRWTEKQPDPTRDQLRMRELAVASLARVFYQVGHNLWMEGDRQKAVASWNTSIKYYATFNQGSPVWLDSLFEASWTYYRVDNFNKSLGLLHTLNSPFFNDEYYPEAMLLQAQIYFTNCHFDRVMYILDAFKESYPPLKEMLEAKLVNLIQPEDVYKFLRETTAESGGFDPTEKQVFNAALKDRELRRMLAYIDALDEEIQRIRTAPEKGWANHEIARTLIQDIEFTKGFAMVSAGNKAKDRLERVVDELGVLNNKALDIEIETTEKFAEMADQQGLDPNALQAIEVEINSLMSADDEHVFWTFDGEYWRDELGYYWYYITSRCGR